MSPNDKENLLLNPSCFSLLAVVFLFGCISKQVHYEIPPSRHALTHISQLHVDQFAGQDALLFKDILIQEIYRIPNFDYEEVFPDGDPHAAAISGEVLVYSVRDNPELRDKTQVSLIQKDALELPEGDNQRLRQQVFDFVEVPFQERAIHRTLDLDIRFVVASATSGKVLYQNTERQSFQQSYVGEKNILAMPLARDEMERLGTRLIHRFLEKINPSLSSKTLQLETGTAPLSWTWDLVDVGHPRILAANRHAIAEDYEKAIKSWNYVIFSPQSFDQDEFLFTDEVYANLKAAQLPEKVIEPLLELRDQLFTLPELDKTLPQLIGVKDFRKYNSIIKAHARSSNSQDRLNLAAAHYNLGAVYRLQNKLDLAAYHFAQANAFSPKEKYAQAWTDVQHELEDFSSFDTMMERTIEKASKQLAPADALVRATAEAKEEDADNAKYPTLQPVELPMLFEESQEVVQPPPPVKVLEENQAEVLPQPLPIEPEKRLDLD